MPQFLARKLFPVLLMTGICALPVPASANPFEVTLPNGLKVVVKEDRRAPVFVQQLWYRAGSMDEFNGTTGVAHVLEHMMFKGTPGVPSGKFSERIAAAGGRENAFTSRDYTAYFQQMERSKLALAMELESDRMSNLLIPPEEFAKEIKVVMEERRLRTEDKPQSLVYEQLAATAYSTHPYRNPVIGWMSDLESLTAADARTWYERWYAPNNATLVVVGDVDHRVVFDLARRYYGGVTKRVLPERKPQHEPQQRGLRRITVKAPAKLPYLAMAWHAPTLRDLERDWEPYALEVLVGILDGNPSARLNRQLVRESRLAAEVGAGYDALARGPGLFMVDGTPSEGQSVDALESGLRGEIARLQREGVTAEELARVKSQITAAKVFQLDSIFYQAMLIGELESTGFNHRGQETRLGRLQLVTAEQVQAVARKYLVDDALTVAVLDPQPLDGVSRAPAGRKGGGHAH